MRYFGNRETNFVSAEMGAYSPPLLLICICLAAALINGAFSEGACLQDGKHKATPSPEAHLTECGMYAESEYCVQRRKC